MKAIFIPRNFDGSNMESLNRDLMNTKDIIRDMCFDSGTLLIVDNVSREDKLKKLRSLDKNDDPKPSCI